MSLVTVHRGVGEDDQINLDLGGTETLAAVRSDLEARRFISRDSSTQKFRFINMKQADFGHDAKASIDKDLEDALPAAKVQGQAGQLILTNIVGKRPDLVGIGTDWFFDRFVAARILLNKHDRSAIESNKEKNAFAPLMLTNVAPTTNVAGYWDNVCVCVEGSVVEFEVKSWGAMGFEVQVSDELTGPFWQRWVRFDPANKDSYATLLAGHFGADRTIQIQGGDTLNIAGKEDTFRFQKVTIRARRVTAYTLNGTRHESHARPEFNAGLKKAASPGANASASIQRALVKAGAEGVVTVVPGDSIKPGGPTGGPPSDKPLGGGGVDSWEIDDWSQALGNLVIYFFVFKSKEAADRVIRGYNAPAAGLWD